MITFNDVNHGHQLARAAGCYYNPASDSCITREEDGELLGGVIFTNYTRESIAMHVASFRDNWVTRDLIWVCFHYPFVQLGVKRIFGQVPETNTKALHFDLRFGFKILTKIDGVFPDGGMYVVKLERDECRWLDMKPRFLKPGQES